MATTMDGENMKFPVRENGPLKWNLNTLMAIGAGIIPLMVNVFALGVIYSNFSNGMNNLDNRIKAETSLNVERAKQSEANFQSINARLPQFDIIAQQMLRLTELTTANAKQADAINERFNRYVEGQNGKLDIITDKLANLSSDNKVVQSQLNDLKSQLADQKPQRTRFSMPIVRAQ